MPPRLSLIDRWRAAVLWSQARAYDGRGNWWGAMAKAHRICRLYGAAAPGERAPVIVNLMCASLADRLGEHRAAYDACVIVLDQLDRGVGLTRHYGAADIGYLRYYCKTLLAGTTRHVDSTAFGLARSVGETWPDLTPDKVRSSLRRAFPLDGDYGAAFDDYMQANIAMADAPA